MSKLTSLTFARKRDMRRYAIGGACTKKMKEEGKTDRRKRTKRNVKILRRVRQNTRREAPTCAVYSVQRTAYSVQRTAYSVQPPAHTNSVRCSRVYMAVHDAHGTHDYRT